MKPQLEKEMEEYYKRKNAEARGKELYERYVREFREKRRQQRPRWLRWL